MNILSLTASSFEDALILQSRRRISGNLHYHDNEEMALKHARLLEKMTGDRCRVKSCMGGFLVIRLDPGGNDVN